MSDALSERFTGRTPEASQRTSFVAENDTYGNIKINEEAIFKTRFILTGLELCSNFINLYMFTILRPTPIHQIIGTDC